MVDRSITDNRGNRDSFDSEIVDRFRLDPVLVPRLEEVVMET